MPGKVSPVQAEFVRNAQDGFSETEERMGSATALRTVRGGCVHDAHRMPTAVLLRRFSDLSRATRGQVRELVCTVRIIIP
jgi:hypothetical protein